VRLFDSLSEVPEGWGPSAVAIGKFDGVHAGHRRVLAELVAVARRDSLAVTVVTFDRHPLSLLDPTLLPEALLSNNQKVERLASTGVEATLMLTFNDALRQFSPEQFVQVVLVDALHARVVMVGSDFRFGAKGAGTVETLVALGTGHGFSVQLIDDVVGIEDAHDRRASSTWIRELLGAGNVRVAAEVLGTLPTVRSIVVKGVQRGRELGYPTANLSPELEGFIPADGVYAAWLTVGGARYGAAVSIGNNPTFVGVPAKQIEAHVLDETLNLYGAVVEISFVDYIRPMRKFDSVDALILQMNVDEEKIRTILGYPLMGAGNPRRP
jgi:riboflavin kinase/FMN adenylyltransferase